MFSYETEGHCPFVTKTQSSLLRTRWNSTRVGRSLGFVASCSAAVIAAVAVLRQRTAANYDELTS